MNNRRAGLFFQNFSFITCWEAVCRISFSCSLHWFDDHFHYGYFVNFIFLFFLQLLLLISFLATRYTLIWGKNCCIFHFFASFNMSLSCCFSSCYSLELKPHDRATRSILLVLLQFLLRSPSWRGTAWGFVCKYLITFVHQIRISIIVAP